MKNILIIISVVTIFCLSCFKSESEKIYGTGLNNQKKGNYMTAELSYKYILEKYPSSKDARKSSERLIELQKIKEEIAIYSSYEEFQRSHVDKKDLKSIIKLVNKTDKTISKEIFEELSRLSRYPFHLPIPIQAFRKSNKQEEEAKRLNVKGENEYHKWKNYPSKHEHLNNAIAFYRESIFVCADDPFVYNNLALTFLSTKQPSHVVWCILASLKHARKGDNQIIGASLYLLGQVFEDIDQRDFAKWSYSMSLKHRPENEATAKRLEKP